MRFPKNPVAMWGQVERCWLLALRAPEQEVRALLPLPLEPVLHGGFAFYNVVICRIKNMRPWPLPECAGFSYWHIAYRIYVKFRAKDEREIEGLYFLRSDCDKDWLVPTGNLLTDFRFHRASLELEEKAEGRIFRVKSPGADFFLSVGNEVVTDPAEGSPFRSIKEAEHFLKYKPRGICPPSKGSIQVVQIQRDEKDWKHRLVPVKEQRLDFFRNSAARVELCYEVESIPYLWERGRSIGYA